MPVYGGRPSYHLRGKVPFQVAMTGGVTPTAVLATTPTFASSTFNTGMLYAASSGGSYTTGGGTVWPTGAGYTSGSQATIRANLMTLISNAGSGTDATHHVRHIIPAGFQYDISTGLALTGLSHVTFEGSGAEVATSGVWGHTGGATIMTHDNGTGAPDGQTWNKGVFYSGVGGVSVKFTDIRWHCLTLKGNGVGLESNASDDSGENQYGIGSWGGDNGLVDHCIITDMQGDCIELQDTTGAGGYRSHNWEIRYNRLLRSARVNIATQASDNTYIHHNYMQGPGFAYLDIEPDNAGGLVSNLTLDNNVFGGGWMWSNKIFNMGAIFQTASVSQALTGYLRIRNNTFAGTCQHPTNSVRLAMFSMDSHQSLTGEVTITGNVNTGPTSAGPRCIIVNSSGGPVTVTGNTGWCSSGLFLSYSGSVTPVNSGNT